MFQSSITSLDCWHESWCPNDVVTRNDISGRWELLTPRLSKAAKIVLPSVPSNPMLSQSTKPLVKVESLCKCWACSHLNLLLNSGRSSPRSGASTVGLNEPKGLFQPSWFYCSMNILVQMSSEPTGLWLYLTCSSHTRKNWQQTCL